MEWLYGLFIEHSALQAIIVLSFICAVGLMLGKVQFWGVSLGVSCVFFMGILAGHFGLTMEPHVLNFAETFGLVLFIYALGLQVGPGFFSSFRKEGLRLNLLAISIVLLGTLFCVIGSLTTQVSLPDMIGLLCGSTTNTPALGAAQQTLKQLGIPYNTPALACALAYPIGVTGVIFSIILIRKCFVSPNDLPNAKKKEKNQPYVVEFSVCNPAIFNKTIKEVAALQRVKFVISRIWRDGKVFIPTFDKVIHANDKLLVITSEKDLPTLTVLFGEQGNTDWNNEDIDWNAIDSQLVSRRIVITQSELNGKKLGALRLRNHYGINVSRIFRSGVELLATPELTLQLGDRVTVIGERPAVDNVEKLLGNAVKSLEEPNLVAVFIGLVLGLALGSIPLIIPGISAPVKLGLAGGPIIVGMLIGTFGPRLHMVTYTTQSANLMLRALGLAMFLGCLGLRSGGDFFETVIRPEGLLWLGISVVLTVVPIILVGVIALKLMKIDFGSVAGLICGSMANPMALNYANDTIEGDTPSVSYATVYPISMFLRVVLAQIVLLLLL